MGTLLHSNEHLQISTVADRLSMIATCGRIPWEALTKVEDKESKSKVAGLQMNDELERIWKETVLA
jgi:hypothetical protein